MTANTPPITGLNDPELAAILNNPSGGFKPPPKKLDLEALELELQRALDPRHTGVATTDAPQSQEILQSLGHTPITTETDRIKLADLEARSAEYTRKYGIPMQPNQELKPIRFSPQMPEHIGDKYIAEDPSIPKNYSHGKREVSFCIGKEFPPALITRIVARWNLGVPIESIVKDTNFQLQATRQRIEAIDVYAIMMLAKHQETNGGRPKEREKVNDTRPRPNEMSLPQFKLFLTQWKAGSTMATCKKVVQPFEGEFFVRKMFGQLNERWRTFRREEELNKSHKLKNPLMDAMLHQHARRLTLNGQPYLIYPISKLPQEFQKSMDNVAIYDAPIQAAPPKKLLGLVTGSADIPKEEGYAEYARKLDEVLDKQNSAERPSLDRTVALPTAEEPHPFPAVDPDDIDRQENATDQLADMSLEELLNMDILE